MLGESETCINSMTACLQARSCAQSKHLLTEPLVGTFLRDWQHWKGAAFVNMMLDEA